MKRRQFLRTIAHPLLCAGVLSPSLSSCAVRGNTPAHIVVIGGGYGGASCARYLRYFNPDLHVTLLTPERYYYSCPFSNPVIAGIEPASIIRHSYTGLAKNAGVRLIHDTAEGIDPDKKTVQLSGGGQLHYERLVLSPGISFRWNHIFSGYDREAARRMPHAWQGGEQTLLLRQQLRAMPDGGLICIVVPGPAFRCPPGPYERASLIAYYLTQHKPRAKILLLDANEHFSKQDLFEEAWQQRYPNLIERIPISAGGLVLAVDAKKMQIQAEAGRFRVNVGNVIPFQQAGRLAVDSGLTDESGWCPVNHQTFESLHIPNIHIIGDSCIAGAMPKSASSANSQAKVCSLAVVNLLADRPPGEMVYHNTCYSLVAPDYGISINAMFRYEEQRIKLIQQAGGLSPLRAAGAVRRAEADHARSWYRNIHRDSFASP